MSEPAIAHRLEDSGSVASVDLRGVHAFAGSGSAGGTTFTELRAPSLGSSPLSFERAIKTVAIMVAFGSTATCSVDPHLSSSLVPQAIEVPGQPRAHSARSLEGDTPTPVEASIAAIKRELDETAIEDGIIHRAEQLVSTHVTQFGEAGLLDAARSDDSLARAASFLRLLGRSSKMSGLLRGGLVDWGLSSESVEVRDAAVQAIENWADRALAGRLRGREEPIDWLREYAANVARDLDA